MKRQGGLTLIEVVIATAILVLVGAYAIRMIRAMVITLGSIERQSAYLDFSARVETVMNNRESWKRTVEANLTLKDHLRGTSLANSGIEHPLSLLDADDNVVVPKDGGFFSKSGSLTTATDNPWWFVKVTWKGRPDATAETTLTISRTSGTSVDSSTTRRLKQLHASLGQKCITVSAPVVAGSNPAGPNAQRGAPYRFDMAIVQCPAGRERISITLNPGCGAIAPRSSSSANHPDRGACYQISASNPDQQAATQCDPSNVNGTCIATCCSFD